MIELKRVYLDSTVIVDMVKVDIGKAVADDRELDVWHARQLLEAHRNKDVKVLTSTLTIAECTHGGEGEIGADVQRILNGILTSGDYLELIQMTPFVAMDARDLRWNHGITLRGADGIHVASAISERCDELLTTDGKMGRLHHHRDKLLSLGLTVCPARETTSLPAKYRQTGFLDGQTTH